MADDTQGIITGKSALTGREYEPWERVLNVILLVLPYARFLGTAVKLGARLSNDAVKLAKLLAVTAHKSGKRLSSVVKYAKKIGKLSKNQLQRLRLRIKTAKIQGQETLALTDEEQKLVIALEDAKTSLAFEKQPVRLVRPRNRNRMRIVGAQSARRILFSAIRGLRPFWRSRTGRFEVLITPNGQLVGAHEAFKSEAFKAAFPEYAGWHSHHIVEGVHLKRLGVRDLFKTKGELPCVLLPPSSHTSRVGSILKSVNQPKGVWQITEREYFEAYQEAYHLMVDPYTGTGSSRELAKELMSVVSLMLGF